MNQSNSGDSDRSRSHNTTHTHRSDLDWGGFDRGQTPHPSTQNPKPQTLTNASKQAWRPAARFGRVSAKGASLVWRSDCAKAAPPCQQGVYAVVRRVPPLSVVALALGPPRSTRCCPCRTGPWSLFDMFWIPFSNLFIQRPLVGSSTQLRTGTPLFPATHRQAHQRDTPRQDAAPGAAAAGPDDAAATTAGA